MIRSAVEADTAGLHFSTDGLHEINDSSTCLQGEIHWPSCLRLAFCFAYSMCVLASVTRETYASPLWRLASANEPTCPRYISLGKLLHQGGHEEY